LPEKEERPPLPEKEPPLPEKEEPPLPEKERPLSVQNEIFPSSNKDSGVSEQDGRVVSTIHPENNVEGETTPTSTRDSHQIEEQEPAEVQQRRESSFSTGHNSCSGERRESSSSTGHNSCSGERTTVPSSWGSGSNGGGQFQLNNK